MIHYEPTTALKRIARLKKPTKIIQGGQGAGKTIAILILLINHAQHNPGKEITVLGGELSKLKKTVVKDFLKIMKSYGFFNPFRWNKTESIYTFPNGAFIEFIGMDRSDVGKGFRRDVAFFNELNKGGITLDAYMQFASRAGMVYADFNPDRRFWAHDDLLQDDDTDFLILTFNDNEFLPEKERKEILKYREKGFFKPDLPYENLFLPSNIKSKYWANKWKVYGLGIVGAMEGVVYDNYKIIDRVPPEAKYIASGLDWGFANDPTGLIDIYEYEGKRVWDEVFYRNGVTNSDVAALIKSDGRKRTIYADPSEPKSITEVSRYSISIQKARGSAAQREIAYGVDLILQDSFYVTKRSVNALNELRNYTWDTDKDGNLVNKPIDAFNHILDPARYVYISKMTHNKGHYALR